MESILLTIKDTLGVESDFTGFDEEIILTINTAFMSLSQVGVGPEEGYHITSDTEKWSDFFGESPSIEAVKTYISLKSRLFFDPPTTSFLLESIGNQIKELEWRFVVQTEPPATV